MTKYYIAILLAVLLTVCAQTLLKLGANYGKKHNSNIKLFVNKYTPFGILFFLMVTLLNLFALQKVELKEMAFILPSVYIFIPIVSIFILNEKITKLRFIGIAVIVVGMGIFNLGKIL